MNNQIYVIVESSTQIQLEMHRELESAKQATNEINARWGNNEVFIKKIKESAGQKYEK